jgi:ABC-type multidrug transport system ATPase subunit
MSTYGPSASAARGMDLEKGEDLRNPILLTWSDLTYSVKGRLAPIIESVDGSIASGQLMAIMGPSGAGKSTMLDVLCRRVPALRGSVSAIHPTRWHRAPP